MSDLQNLVELQKIDSELQEINDLLGDLPAKVGQLHQEESALVNEVEQGEQRLKEIDLELSKNDLLEKESREKIEKLKNQLFLVTNNKQYDAITHETDHLKEELDKLETIELELREEKTALDETTKSKSLNLDSLRSDLHLRMGKLEKVIAQNDEQKQDLEQKRAEQIKVIPANMFSRYQRVYKARDGVAVVKLLGSACGGCGSVVPPQIATEIKAGVGIKICDVCSRFIYFDKN